MKRDDWLHIFSYLGVSVIAVAMAFYLSTRMLTPTYSQETGAAGGQSASIDGIKTPPTAAEVAAEVQGFLEPYIYDSKNRRNPFQPYQEFKPAGGGPILSPLQKYSLDDLKLVGILWNVHHPKAMFVDPKNKVHIAEQDEGIGRNNGYIATIREGEVVVVQSYNEEGKTVFRTRVLRIGR